MKSKITFALVLSMLLLGGVSFAAQSDMQGRQDNTKVNKRDRNAAEPTADQQMENKSDRDIAKEIRKAIVDDKSLSTYAHNVKVIVQNGSVTLKGPVRSEEEKRAVEAKATEVAGRRNIQNEITIQPEHDSK